MWRAKKEIRLTKYWEVIADNLSKSGWSWGCVATVDREGRTIWIADAHRGDRKRFVVRADEKLTAFLELESAIWPTSFELHFLTKPVLATQFAPQAAKPSKAKPSRETVEPPSGT